MATQRNHCLPALSPLGVCYDIDALRLIHMDGAVLRATLEHGADGRATLLCSRTSRHDV